VCCASRSVRPQTEDENIMELLGISYLVAFLCMGQLRYHVPNFILCSGLWILVCICVKCKDEDKFIGSRKGNI
jgi:hypothetical protein